jgi:hypothetical protein
MKIKINSEYHNGLLITHELFTEMNFNFRHIHIPQLEVHPELSIESNNLDLELGNEIITATKF